MPPSGNQRTTNMAFVQCCGYFGSFMLIVISSIALLVLLLTYFKHIRTLFYVEGNCTVTTSFYTVQVNDKLHAWAAEYVGPKLIILLQHINQYIFYVFVIFL